MTTDVNETAKRGWPLWLILLAAGIIIGLTSGLRQVTGLYMPPVTKELNIGLEPFSTAMAVANLLWGLSGIAAGALADKYGAGKVTVLGILLMIVGYYVMIIASGGSDLMWSGVAIGIGVGCCGMSVMVGVIGRAATADRRTAALATLGMANGIGNFIAFPYTHVLMESLGWKGSIFAVMITLAAFIPLALFVSGKPIVKVGGPKPQKIGEAFTEAFSMSRYWLLIAGFFVCGFHVAFYAVHLPAYAATLGMPSWVAVTALTAVGIANIIGTYIAGQSSKIIRMKYALSMIYLARCFVFLGLLYLPMTPFTLIGLSTLLGFFWLATVPLTSGLVAVFFGTTWLSMLFGFVLFSHQVGSFIGVWMAGVLFDMQKSYDTMWWVSIAVGLFAALVHLPIREEGVPRLKAQPA